MALFLLEVSLCLHKAVYRMETKKNCKSLSAHAVTFPTVNIKAIISKPEKQFVSCLSTLNIIIIDGEETKTVLKTLASSQFSDF